MSLEKPHMIKMHDNDNVAIVANNGGLAAGAVLADGTVVQEHVPQGHKVALVDFAINDPVYRYNVIIGHARKPLQRGSWVNEQRLDIPDPPSLDNLPVATQGVIQPALEGYSFQGFRNADGSVGTRNILAISTSVQCVSGGCGPCRAQDP